MKEEIQITRMEKYIQILKFAINRRSGKTKY